MNDNNHPNNVFIEAIKPAEKGGETGLPGLRGELKTRSDDQDGAAIDKRHAIYYNIQDGTLAAVNYFRDKAKKGQSQLKVIELDGRPGVKEVSEYLLKKLE